VAIPLPVVLLAVQLLSPRASDSTDRAMTELTLTPDHGTLVAQLHAVVQRARHTSHMTIVDVGAPWCMACHTLDTFLHSAEMQRAMRGIQLVHLNFDFWAESLDSLGVAASDSAIPVIFVIDSAGRPGALLRGMDEKRVRQFITAARLR
jgi:thiol:disulfide interchange protein